MKVIKENVLPGKYVHLQHSVDKSFHLMNIRLCDMCFTKHIPAHSSYDARGNNNQVFIKCASLCIVIAFMMKTIVNMYIYSHLKLLIAFCHKDLKIYFEVVIKVI